MGTDIHMSIINSKGDFVKRNIFEGRDYEWFDNLQNNGWDNIYNNFPNIDGIPELVPEIIKSNYSLEPGWGFYGFYHIKVADFVEWFSKVRPDIDAAWLSTHEKWLYEAKGVYPENASYYLDAECNRDDYHFVEITNPKDSSAWLFNFIKNADNGISDDDYIVYYFDC